MNGGGQYAYTNAGGWGQTELRANMNPDELPNADGVVRGFGDSNYVWDAIPDDQQQAILALVHST